MSGARGSGGLSLKGQQQWFGGGGGGGGGGSSSSSSFRASYSGLGAAGDGGLQGGTIADEKSPVCVKNRCFGGRCSCFCFASRRDGITCCFLTLSVVAFVLAAVAPVLLNKLLNDGINEAVVIDSPTSASYAAWQTNLEGPGAEMAPIYYQLTFFDIQNEAAVLAGAKPVVVERGPYSFREYYEKFDVSFADQGNVVSYNKRTFYVFDPETSVPGASENDTFTLPYPTALAFEFLLSTIPVNASVLLDTFLEDKLTAAQIRIDTKLDAAYAKVDAIPSRLLPQKDSILQGILDAETAVNAIFAEISSFVAQSSPTTLLLKLLMGTTSGGQRISPFFKEKVGPAYFGWLNDTLLLEVQKIIDKLPTPVPWTSAVPGAEVNWTSVEDRRRRRGPDTLYTGKQDTKQIAQFIKYQDQLLNYGCIAPMNSQDPATYTEGREFPACEIFDPAWNESTAEKKGYRLACASGSDANNIRGSNGEQFGRPSMGDKLDIFVGSVFRSLHMDHVATTDDWYGVKLDRYKIHIQDFWNDTQIPSNAQYFAFGPSGLVNLTQATNAPSYASYPHFLDADPSLVSEVVGLSPDPDAHMTYLDVEPNTGMLARAHKVLQSSFLVSEMHFPTTAENYAAALATACANASLVIAEINKSQNLTLPVPTCNLTAATFVLDLMALETDWNIRRQPVTGRNEIFVPSSWVKEATVGTEQSAEDIKSSVYLVQNLAAGTFQWGMVTGGVFLALALGMLLAARLSVDPASTAAAKLRLQEQEQHKMAGALAPLVDNDDDYEGEGEGEGDEEAAAASKDGGLSQPLLAH